jgi:hypothetical protein
LINADPFAVFIDPELSIFYFITSRYIALSDFQKCSSIWP